MLQLGRPWRANNLFTEYFKTDIPCRERNKPQFMFLRKVSAVVEEKARTKDQPRKSYVCEYLKCSTERRVLFEMQSILNLPLLTHNLQRLLTGLLGMNKLIKLIKIN